MAVFSLAKVMRQCRFAAGARKTPRRTLPVTQSQSCCTGNESSKSAPSGNNVRSAMEQRSLSPGVIGAGCTAPPVAPCVTSSPTPGPATGKQGPQPCRPWSTPKRTGSCPSRTGSRWSGSRVPTRSGSPVRRNRLASRLAQSAAPRAKFDNNRRKGRARNAGPMMLLPLL